MRRKCWLFAPVAIVGFAAFIALGGFVVQQLWNWLMPAIFGLHALTFWQGLGIAGAVPDSVRRVQGQRFRASMPSAARWATGGTTCRPRIATGSARGCAGHGAGARRPGAREIPGPVKA